MKLLIIVPSLVRAGAETQAVDLANGLAERGHDVHLCTFERELDQLTELSNTVHFHHVLRHRKYDFSVPRRLAGLIDRHGVEVALGNRQLATLVAFLAARRTHRRPPVISALHSTLTSTRRQELVDRVLYRRVLSQLPAVVFVCRYQRDHWVRKYPELGRTARVVHNGVDPTRFVPSDFQFSAAELRAKLGISRNAFVFSCIAGFRPVKGHDLLIKAFVEMPINTHLLLAGDGETRSSTEAAVRSAGVANRVRFLGNLHDVRPLIVASNATVLSSRSETFSMAMLESMALGVPMVAPNISGLPEAIIPGRTGLLFPPGDCTALATSMKTLALNPALAGDLGAQARNHVIDRFTTSGMLARYEQILLDASGA